jgi:hypothetical protein
MEIKIEDLAFMVEVTEENTKSINGVFFIDPVARANEFSELVFSGASQGEIGLYLFDQHLNDMATFYEEMYGIT